jgi:phosphatidylserine/phosphatidylglycerophosphate/cardiolipin synthase-like enzyme/uncharacterized membrane protein YdjX (TVP38/TMEM64 family)
VLIDGSAFFPALREAIVQAQRTVFIVGWDLDSRMKLMPEGAQDGYPDPLCDFLHAVTASRRHLCIYILAWDFAMLYAFEREWLPVYKMGWRTHRRMRFKQDGKHPLGGSHHQKIVVVDDRLAFVGGLDLTRSRWDTPAHAPAEPLRRDPNGARYPPFHDVQVMFDGDAAREVGQLVRERWRRACGRAVAIRARRSARDDVDLWPARTPVDVEDVELGISCTDPAYLGRPGVFHLRTLYLDGIAAARRNIYIENQYFTAGSIGDALRQRLNQAHGPDLAIVVPRNQSGWLQEATMGVLRARLHRLLQSADASGRYRMYAPHIEGLRDGTIINVHSKLMIVDDDLLVIGSANLNNRSLVLDTECDVALEARGDPRLRRAIASVRDRLLAEHLDVPHATVACAFEVHEGLNAAIESLRHGPRRLDAIEPQVSPDLDALIPAEALIDPEQPVEPDRLVRQFVPEDRRQPLAGRFLGLGAVVLAIALCAAVWRFTPLGQHLNLAEMVGGARRVSGLPFSPALIVGAYVLASLVLVPITLLIAVTGVVFGAWLGGVYAFVGTGLAAGVTYGIGRWLGRDWVRRMAGPRLNKLSERVGERGLFAVMVIRILPVAPFTIVNMMAGASHIGIRDFLVGTLLGMGPGMVLTVSFAQQLATAVHHPTPGAFAFLVAIGVTLVGVSWLLRRLFRQRDGQATGRKPCA